MSIGGGCGVSVDERTRCGWFKLRECSKFLHGKRSPIKWKDTVYKSYVMTAILY